MADVADPILEYEGVAERFASDSPRESLYTTLNIWVHASSFVCARLVDVEDPLEEDFFEVAIAVEIGSEVAASIRHPLPEQFP